MSHSGFSKQGLFVKGASSHLWLTVKMSIGDQDMSHFHVSVSGAASGGLNVDRNRTKKQTN